MKFTFSHIAPAIAVLAIPVASWGQVADAAESRDAARVTTLIRQHADINAPQADGTTALHWAAHWNNLQLVNQLLAAKANVNAANRYGDTPLSEAATVGNAQMIAALLKAGADPSHADSQDGETPLMLAARAGSVEGVKLLLDKGANVNQRETYKGQTALMWAAAERHPDVVKLLLARGADATIRSNEHETKLPKLSAASSITPMPRGGLTALIFAAREGDVASAEALLKAGADINQSDVEKTTPLVVSLMNKQYTLAKFLLDKGADPNLADTRGRAALYAAIDARNEDYSAMPMRKESDPLSGEAIVLALLEHQANPNAGLTRPIPGRSGMDYGDTALNEGATPLMRAARAGDVPVMKILLSHGADPAQTTKDGNTALGFAAGVGYRDKNTKGTEAQALEALQLLVSLGGDINHANSRGETPLHGACLRGADTIVHYLADKGAKFDVKTKLGHTPLDVAMGKSVVGQLPVPHDSTVALVKKLGGREGDTKTVAEVLKQ